MTNFAARAAAFLAGVAAVAAVLALLITSPGDTQQRDLYFPLFVDRVIESTVYPLWSPQSTLNIGGAGRLPLTLALVGVARVFDLSDASYGRLLILWVAFAGYAAAFTGYLLFARWRPTRRRWPDTLGAMVAGFVFVINPWTIVKLEHAWMLAPWALMPLALGMVAEGTRSGRRGWIVGSALLMAVLGATQPHYLAFTGVFVLVWTAVMVSRHRGLRTTLVDLGTWGGVVLLGGAYFLAPYFAVQVLGGSSNPAYTLMDQTRTMAMFQDLPNTLLGSANHNWRAAVVPAAADRLAWELAGWLVALLPVAALISRAWRRPAVFFALAGYGAVALAVASAWAPTADLYQLAVNQVPGGWLLREPDKLSGIVVWSQAMAAGVVVSALLGGAGGVRAGARRWAPRAGLAAYVIAALALHASPAAAAVLWNPEQRGYVPVMLPSDYRRVLAAVDADAFRDGRVLVASSDERSPDWDRRRILRMIETLSLASASVGGDTRSPVPPAPVQGRWFEFFYAAGAEEALEAARRAGFSHILVVRDYPAGVRTAEALAGRDDLEVIDTGANLWAARLAPQSQPRVGAARPVVVDRLDVQPATDEAAILANHTAGLRLPDGIQPRARGADAAIDLAFARLDEQRLTAVTPWFGTRGRTERWIWGEVYADERQSWLRELKRAGLESWEADYGLGLALAPPDELREELVVHLPVKPEGRVWLRVFASPQSAWIEVRADGTVRRVSTRSATSGWRWIDLGELADERLGIVPGPGFEAVNVVAAPPAGWSPAAPGPSDRFIQPQVSYTRLSASVYEAQLSGADGLAFIVLREGFDPVWRAHADTPVIGPFLTDGLWNGYIVEVQGPTKVRFEYGAARWYDAGIGISIGTVAALALWTIGFAALRRARRRVGAPRRANRGRAQGRHQAAPRPGRCSLSFSEGRGLG